MNKHYLLGKTHYQGNQRLCVAYACVHGLQFMARYEAALMKGDPNLVGDLNPLRLDGTFRDKFKEYDPTKSIRFNRFVHMPLILQEIGLADSKRSKIHKVDDVIVIPRNDFQRISTSIAEGDVLLATFFTGKKFAKLKYGQIYKPYRSIKYRDNSRKKLIGHAVFLIGAARQNKEEYFHMVNSYSRFCERRNSKGEVIKSGIGMLRASGLKENVICLRRGTRGEAEWRLQPQTEIELNAHNTDLMSALKPRLAKQPDIDRKSVV